MRIELIKAFTKSPEAGNPAGIVFASEHIADSAMVQIAERVNLTATAFLFPSINNVIPIRFFSSRTESALCVHALLGAAERWQAWHGGYGALTFRASRDDFLVTRNADGAFMVNLPVPKFGVIVTDVSRVAMSLRIPVDSVDDLPVEVVSTGKPKIIIPIRSLRELLGISPDEQAVIELCRDVAAEGIFLFSRDVLDPRCSFHARHWNRIALDSEDPICGNGSGALAAYLDRNRISAPARFFVEMGVATKVPSQVVVERESQIRVGGFAVKYGEIEF
jgi:trans-2,3-dihydro-3-hydroxyanthranilate isomerase